MLDWKTTPDNAPAAEDPKPAAATAGGWTGEVVEESLWDGAPPWEQPAAPRAPHVPRPPEEPRERKPLPKWVIPAAAAVVVVIAAGVVLRVVNTPERAAERFLEALDTGDAAVVAKAATAREEGETLTAEQLQPLVRLYTEDEDFRDLVEERLEADIERIREMPQTSSGDLFSLRGKKHVFFTTYDVVVGTCDAVEIRADLAGIVTVEGGHTVDMRPNRGDNTLMQWSSGTLKELLPGRYDMEGTVETDYGVTITGQATLTVDDRNTSYGELRYDYTTVEVFNDSNVSMELLVGDSDTPVETLEPWYTCTVGPVLADTPIRAVAVAPLAEEPPVVEFDGSVGYQEVRFDLNSVEIYNAYGAPVTVYRGEDVLAEIPGGESQQLTGLETGTELTVALTEDGVAEPETYTVESGDYNSFTPNLVLTKGTEEAVKAQVIAHMQQVITLYNDGDLMLLNELAETSGAAEYWRGKLVDLREDESGDRSYSYYSAVDGAALTVEEWDLSLTVGNLPDQDADTIGVDVYAQMRVPCTQNYVYSDGDVDSSEMELYLYTNLSLAYVNGQWVVAA